MKTYVLFNSDTGEIIHIHHEVALIGDTLSVSKDELLADEAILFLEDRISAQNLDMLEVDENSHLIRRTYSPDDEKELYVDIESRAVLQRDKHQDVGASDG